MPISSFHGLRKNSVPTKPWNSTKTSPQKTSLRESPTHTARKRSYGVPRLWENEFQESFGEEQDEAKHFKSYRSPVATYTQKNYGKTPRRSSINSRPRSARQERGVKRRDTFPKFQGEISSLRTAERVFRRSKTDPSIIPDKKARKNSNKPPQRPTTLWTTDKKVEKASPKFHRRKVGGYCSRHCNINVKHKLLVLDAISGHLDYSSFAMQLLNLISK